MTAAMDAAQQQRLEQAADWLQQLQGRQCDEGVVERWLDWCAQDPRNQQAFDAISAIWEAAGDATGAQPSRAPASPPRWYRSSRALAAGIAGLAFAALAVFAVLRWQPVVHDSLHALASPAGENSRTELPDGSVIELGGLSEAAVALSRHERRVDLRSGQLFVTVAPDAARPFVVDAGGLQVAAVGTAFDVLQEPGRTVVTVMEGRTDVRIASGSAQAVPIRLGAGQQLAYERGSASLPVRWVDPAVSTAWRSGVLKFVDEPLNHVVASINRYVDRQIVIDDPSIGALAFTGTAHVDRIESWLAALPDAFPVSVVELPDGRRLLGARLREAGSASARP